MNQTEQNEPRIIPFLRTIETPIPKRNSDAGSLQRAIESALDKPRAYYAYKAATFDAAHASLGSEDAGYTGVLRRGSSQSRRPVFGNERPPAVSKGFGYVLTFCSH